MVPVILTILLLFTSPVWATTYYVATTGSNSNDGLTEETPKQTVAHCVSLMVAGDTCLVMEGDYSEGVIRFGRTGTQTSPIRLAAYPGASPKITFIDPEGTLDRILIQHFSGSNRAMGWITIEGLELTNGHEGIKYYNLHNGIFRNNWIHHNGYQGILGNAGGHHNLFEKNIFNHNGRFAACDAGSTTLCQHDHGIYAHGQSYTIRSNIFYDNIGYGLQQNGSSTAVYSSSTHAGTEFAGAANWIVESNTFAYSYNRAGMVVWGSLATNSRIENNIFFENAVNSNSEPQGVKCTGCSGSTGVQIRNNLFYASGSGGTTGIGSGFNADLVSTGNVTNVSAPTFVNGGSNALPASPDFRLTASAPVNICRTNEFPNNSTCVVGAYKTIGAPTASMTTNVMTVTYPMSTAVPINIPSATGWSVTCTANPTACPASPAVSSVTRRTGTDSQVDITISGITSNACAAGQDWKFSYNSSTGSASGNDNIGPYPGFGQNIFSSTDILATNACTGSGPPAGSSSYINYPMEDGSGTTVSDTSGNALHGTLVGGASWVSGHTGYGVLISSASQQLTIPYGIGVNPSTQSMTWVLAVNVPAGQEAATQFAFGTEAGTNQRGYIGGRSGTWRVAAQSTPLSATSSSNLTVEAGWNHLCLPWDSGTDTFTLYKNGVAGTGGATGSYTSFMFPTNIEAPIIGSGFSATTVFSTYDDIQIFTSVEDCAALYAAWNPPPPAAGDTFSQTAVQFEEVYTSGVSGTVRVLPSPSNTKKVVKGGAVALAFQVECNNCAATSFRLTARDNGTGEWLQVANTETASNVYMWGTSTPQFLNNAILGTRILANGCTVVDGSTQATADQIPTLTLPASGCTMLRHLIRVRSGASGYTEFRLENEGGVAFTGSYVLGRIDIADTSAGMGQ